MSVKPEGNSAALPRQLLYQSHRSPRPALSQYETGRGVNPGLSVIVLRQYRAWRQELPGPDLPGLPLPLPSALPPPLPPLPGPFGPD